MKPEWHEHLVCPLCKGKLVFHSNKQEYWCLFDGIAFPLKGKSPIFINSCARTLSADEKLNSAKHKHRD